MHKTLVQLGRCMGFLVSGVIEKIADQLTKNPESVALANELLKHKDEVTKLNLRIELLEKNSNKRTEDINVIEPDFWPC